MSEFRTDGDRYDTKDKWDFHSSMMGGRPKEKLMMYDGFRGSYGYEDRHKLKGSVMRRLTDNEFQFLMKRNQNMNKEVYGG